MVQLHGLVLAGGKSERMGTDKGKMIWHGKEHRYWMADLLTNYCNDVFISCRTDQVMEIEAQHYKTIPDELPNRGPLGAVLSAFNTVAGVAWLVTACDMPFIDGSAIQYLIEHRNSTAIATTYESPTDHLPEPLMAIWEPHAELFLRKSLHEKKLSLRQILIQQEAVRCISPLHPASLINVNTAADTTIQINEFPIKKCYGNN